MFLSKSQVRGAWWCLVCRLCKHRLYIRPSCLTLPQLDLVSATPVTHQVCHHRRGLSCFVWVERFTESIIRLIIIWIWCSNFHSFSVYYTSIQCVPSPHLVLCTRGLSHCLHPVVKPEKNVLKQSKHGPLEGQKTGPPVLRIDFQKTECKWEQLQSDPSDPIIFTLQIHRVNRMNWPGGDLAVTDRDGIQGRAAGPEAACARVAPESPRGSHSHSSAHHYLP